MHRRSRYTAVAIGLHWIIAAAILTNLVLGLWMSWAIDSAAQAQAIFTFQLHKAIGLTVLVLSLLRLAWRFLYPPPGLPAHMARWERAAASITHWLFYGLMIAIPLSGWLYVSVQWRGDAPFTIPTLWFGLFEVPHLFGLHEASAELRHRLASVALDLHGALVLGAVLLLVLHVIAALRHQFWQRDGVLARMLPWLTTPERLAAPARRPEGGLTGTVAAVATLAIAAAFIGYATTTTLIPQDTEEKPDAALVLQGLVAAEEPRTPEWPVNTSASDIRFAGVHAGRPFKGSFKSWQAAIYFDPQNLEQSRIVAVVETGSATTGVTLHDRTLPQGEWFDVANHPYASYHSTAVRHLEGSRYELEGTLTIKGHAVKLPAFTLTADGNTLHIRGEVELDRAEVDMGMASDPQGQYVSRSIVIRVDVTAASP